MATPINNSASATYAYGGRAISTTATSNIATTNLITDYAISAYKSSLNTAFRSGQNITYYVNISNDGTQPLYNVTISDDLGGAGNPLNYVTASAKLNLNGTITDITPNTLSPLTFILPNPLAGGEKATVTYVTQVSTAILPTVTEITNTATVQANEGSAGGAVISVTPSPSLTLPVEDFAQISMNKTVSSNQITVGEQFSYFINLTNSGNLEATNVVIKDVLPTNFVISSITALTQGNLTTFTPSDYDLDAPSNTLTLPNDSSSLSITVPASSGTLDGTTLITINGSITA